MRIHGVNVFGEGKGSQGGRSRVGWTRASLVLVFLLLPGCDSSSPVVPPTTRFGQVGEIRVEVTTPLGAPGGLLRQRIVWRSSGAWQLDEEITYRGLVGDATRRRPAGDPGGFASSYATLIAQVNETPGLRLFIPELDATLEPDCGTGAATIRLEIEDTSRQEMGRWIRCSQGPLSSVRPQGSGPDADASRVAASVAAVRDFTLGSNYRSPYLGSLPFGTLDRGEDSGVALDRPLFFLPVLDGSGTPRAPGGWASFWQSHTRGTRPPPLVDWTREMVVVGAVGLRTEAGDSVRVQRVLQVSNGAIVELVERVPGDFCSPATRSQYPFHIVVLPVTPPAIEFADVRVERVPCGI